MHHKLFNLRVTNLLNAQKVLVELMRNLGKTQHVIKVETTSLRVYFSLHDENDCLEVIDKRCRKDRPLNMGLEVRCWGYDINTTQELSTVERGLDLLIRNWSEAWRLVHGLHKKNERLYPCLLRTYSERAVHMQNLCNEFYKPKPMIYNHVDLLGLDFYLRKDLKNADSTC